MEPWEVRLMPYDPEWVNDFLAIRSALSVKLKISMNSFHHFGSTSIEGCDAKPIIDVALEVENLPKHAFLVKALQKLGFGAFRMHFVTDLISLSNITKNPSVNLYLVEGGTQTLRDWLTFRDALRCCSRSLERYVALKYDLAEKWPSSRSRYTASKKSFVEEILNKKIMMKESWSESYEAFGLYVKYDDLSVEDLRDILSAIQSVFDVSRRIFVTYPFEYNAPVGSETVYHLPKLVVKEVHTGNSIDIKISFANTIFPKLKKKKKKKGGKGETTVVVPYWSAVLYACFCGMQNGSEGFLAIKEVYDSIVGEEASSEMPPHYEAELKAALAEIEALRARVNLLEFKATLIRTEDDREE